MKSMMKTLGLDKLTPMERLGLLEELWESLDDHADELHVPEHHRTELDRRLREFEENPSAGSTWEEVKARLLGGP